MQNSTGTSRNPIATYRPVFFRCTEYFAGQTAENTDITSTLPGSGPSNYVQRLAVLAPNRPARADNRPES